MSNCFTGKVALVVGGAHADESKSLGFAGLSALEIARAGGKVVIADIDDEAGEQSAAKMRDDGLTARYVHITIMAAGVNDRGNPIETTDVDVWQRVMDVTNLGMFLAVKSSVRPMRESGGGSIVLISSMMARIVRQNSSAYATSRAGMTHFARSAAVQYGPDNIRVNSVLPGWAVTPFTIDAFDDEWMAQMAKRVPLGRVADASDIAGSILFLASDEAAYVTGSELLVDGGVTAWIGPVG